MPSCMWKPYNLIRYRFCLCPADPVLCGLSISGYDQITKNICLYTVETIYLVWNSSILKQNWENTVSRSYTENPPKKPHNKSMVQ